MSPARKKNRLPPFVAVLKEMLKSEAWEAISNPARVAYIHLKGKCITANGGEITLSFKEMERIMDRHTFSRALGQLVAHGFIIKDQRGGMFRKRNFYRFSEQWKTFTRK
jgi:hypothetical protein